MIASLVHRSCPVCLSGEAAELLIKQTLRLAQCRACAMVYASPVAVELVNGDYYDQLANPFYLSPDKLQSDYSTVRFARELKLFRQFCKSGNVLDVGCSTGAFLYQLKTRFGRDYQGTGMDVAGPALDHAEKMGVNILREPFLSANFKGQTFNAVTFWAVMEHLLNPRDFLAKAAGLIAPDGVCLILVPNYRSLAVRVVGAKYRYIFPQHLNYFTNLTLQKLAATDSRLELIHAASMHFNPVVIAQDWRGNGEFVADADRAALLKKTTAYKRNPLLQPVKWALSGIEKLLGALNLADNLILVLRKK